MVSHRFSGFQKIHGLLSLSTRDYRAFSVSQHVCGFRLAKKSKTVIQMVKNAKKATQKTSNRADGNHDHEEEEKEGQQQHGRGWKNYYFHAKIEIDNFTFGKLIFI